MALSPDFYAENSVLAEGRWVRINVSSTGIQMIPDATLRAMGFSDVNKVRVYGTGGRQLPEYLNNSMTDDLPLLPSVKSSRGLIFFATDNVDWTPESGSAPYLHTQNSYNTDSYYFLSDREAPDVELPSIAAPAEANNPLTVFMDRALHEEDLQGPDQTGRVILGEDFRTQRTREFSFSATDATGDNGILRIQFGACSTAETSLTISVNGDRLSAASDDKIRAITGSNFINYITTVKEFEPRNGNNAVSITYNPTGTVTKALLDYIEFFYPRHLNKSGASLNFYLNPVNGAQAQISGCSSSTIFWDVTDPVKPVKVNALVAGDKAVINVSPGYHHFVAFDSESVTADGITWASVKNQNIHGMPTPDMIIISPETYRQGADLIADLHREVDGMDVIVFQPEEVYNEFSGGTPDVTAFRKLFKMFYDRPGERELRYALMMGRPFYDNKGTTSAARSLDYTPLPIWQSPTGNSETASYSTDVYLALLEDHTLPLNMANATQCIAVGRLPVTNARNSMEIAEKINKYVRQPDYGSWRNKIMLIADDADDSMISSRPSSNSSFFDQSQQVYNLMTSNARGANYAYDRVLLDAFQQEFTGQGRTYPAAKERMMSNWNEGVVWTNYIGHASTTSWTGERLLTWTDMNNFTNSRLTFLYGATCSFCYWDAKEISGGELMVMNPNAGAIGMITPSRTVYITNNSRLNDEIVKVLFEKNEKGEQNRVGDIFRQGLNAMSNDYNKLRYCLISDPAITLPVPEHTVDILSIDDNMISGDNDAPEIPALGKVTVKGRILDKNSDIDSDFNGIIELMLYDAEKVVETKNTGRGLDRVYNDRSVRLATSKVRVVNGEWSTRLMLPLEISNNYSPALISAYAWNENSGHEAHGHNTNLYVYGYPTEPDPDSTGPEIQNFYLNAPSFANGNVVNANPLVFATLQDDSGINVSDFGIGHQISLSLDDKTFYGDVNSYFTPSADVEGAGSICYPLEDIEPGRHTLTLTVWDNAGNSSAASLDFNVGAAIDPVITDLSTDVNPASTSVTFSLSVDRPNSPLEIQLDVFDLSGRRVWNYQSQVTTDMQSNVRIPWNLCDTAGIRVPRGIYLYRATVTSPEGTYSSKTRKLAVTAQ